MFPESRRMFPESRRMFPEPRAMFPMTQADLIKAFDLDHEGAALSEVAAKKARKEKAGANNKDKKSK